MLGAEVADSVGGFDEAFEHCCPGHGGEGVREVGAHKDVMSTIAAAVVRSSDSVEDAARCRTLSPFSLLPLFPPLSPSLVIYQQCL